MPRKKPPKEGKKLTPRQAAFVAALLADPKQCYTAAAKAAGYASPEKTGWDLMNLPQYLHVQEGVAAQAKARLARYAMDAEEWMGRACAMVRIDRRKIFKWDGKTLEVTPTDQLLAEEAMLIREVNSAEMDYGKAGRLKLVDPTPYFQMIGKALGQFRERVEVDVNVAFRDAEESLASKFADLERALAREVAGKPESSGEVST